MSSIILSQKAVLIILPGWGGTRQTWHEFIRLAEKDFEVRCLELPCFGAEPEPDSVWGISEYVEFVKNKILEINYSSSASGQKSDRKLIILGHSFGGQVAVQLVGTNSIICDTLILSGPAIFRKNWSFKALIFWPIAKLGRLFFSVSPFKKLEKTVRHEFYKLIDSPDYTQTSGRTRAIFQKITKQDVSEFLPQITVPTLVIAGEGDTSVSASASARAARLIRKATFVSVSNGTHGLHRQNPIEFLSIIKNYLTSL